MTTDLPVWVWRRRARFLAKWAALPPAIVFGGLAYIFAVALARSPSGGAIHAEKLEIVGVILFFCVAVTVVPAIGFLVVEKVARELFVRREKIKEGTIATGEASARAAKSWVADGFKEEEAKRPSEEQE